MTPNEMVATEIGFLRIVIVAKCVGSEAVLTFSSQHYTRTQYP